jgi:hypothetical protein
MRYFHPALINRHKTQMKIVVRFLFISLMLTSSSSFPETRTIDLSVIRNNEPIESTSCALDLIKCESKANDGEVEYQYGMARLYERGYKVLKDPMEAFKWYKKAAKQDYKYAQYKLGLHYLLAKGSTICSLMGTCVKQSNKKAAYWIKLADQNGHEGAKDIWNKYKLWKYD